MFNTTGFVFLTLTRADIIELHSSHTSKIYFSTGRSKEFIDGVHYFLRVADANKHKGFICCPCDKCKNQKEYSTLKTIISACLSRGSCLAIIGGPSTES